MRHHPPTHIDGARSEGRGLDWIGLDLEMAELVLIEASRECGGGEENSLRAVGC